MTCNNEYGILGRLHLYFLIVPVYLRLVLPETIEISLTIDFFGYGLFLPEFLYLLLPFFALRKKSILTSSKIKMIFLILIGMLLAYMSSLNGGTITAVNNFFAGSDFYIMLFFFTVFPIGHKEIKYLFAPTLVVFTIISLEVILYSFGFLTYTTALSGVEGFSDISRISTTIGAATGTAIAYFMLTAMLYYLAPVKYKKIIFIISFFVSFVTLTRSVMIAQVIMAFFVFKENITKNKTSKVVRFLRFFILLSILIFGVFKMGVVDSILSRNSALEYGGRDVSNGRFERWDKANDYIKEYPILGSGANFVTEHKRARYSDVTCKNLFSPHNTFILVLMETGIIGLIIFVICIKKLIQPINLKQLTILKLMLLLTVFIFMNTEIVFLFMEFTGLFLIMCNLTKDEENIIR